MSDRLRYITLMSSLPHIGRIFTEHGTGISRFRLEERLKLLSPDHRKLLDRVIGVTAWTGVGQYGTDAEIIALAGSVMAELGDYPTLQALVQSRMETRTIIAALRRRRDGAADPGDVASWGFGRWCRRIQENWSDPGFGLSHFMPWVAEADQHLRSGNHVAVERLVLTQAFTQIDRLASGHDFDFEAVVIYVLRWIIVERWSLYSATKAAERLRQLLDEALSTASPPHAAVPPAAIPADPAARQEVRP
ncbi:MAG TPA: hypothetical protein VIQ53_13450 [Inquilinus sp.]